MADPTGRARWMLLLLALLAVPSLRGGHAFPALSRLGEVSAQHAAFRVKGRVITDRGEPIPNADVRLEAFFGYAAGSTAASLLSPLLQPGVKAPIVRCVSAWALANGIAAASTGS